MNKNYNYLLLSALATTACQHSTKTAVLPKQPRLASISENKEQVPKPIHQAETKQLIQAIPPYTAFCVWVSSEKFKELGLSLKDFVQVVLNQDNKGLIFYCKKVEQDVLPFLQHYYTKNPTGVDIKTIAVEDPLDFNALISKTASIRRGKKKTTIENPCVTSLQYLKYYIGPNNNALYQGYSALDFNHIATAYDNIPYQTGSAECSVNAAARAIILAGGNITTEEYYPFVGKCPTIGRTLNTISKGTAFGGWAAGVGGFLLCLVPGGAAVGVPMALTGIGGGLVGGAGLAFTENRKSASRFGVDPWDLSDHIDRYLPNSYTYSYVHCYDDFYAYEAAVKQDITNNEPVIAFFFFETTAWHYANIVAIKENDSGGIAEFILLDTRQEKQLKIFEIIKQEDMEYLTRNIYKHMTSLALWNEPHYNYYLIRFKKK